jgi:hypothetical protein
LDPLESSLIHDFLTTPRTFEEYNTHLATRTYLVGNGFIVHLTYIDLTLADIYVWAQVLFPKRAQVIGRQSHLLRYFDLIQRRVLKSGSVEGLKIVDVEMETLPVEKKEEVVKVEKKKEGADKVDKKKKVKEHK